MTLHQCVLAESHLALIASLLLMNSAGEPLLTTLQLIQKTPFPRHNIKLLSESMRAWWLGTTARKKPWICGEKTNVLEQMNLEEDGPGWIYGYWFCSVQLQVTPTLMRGG